MSPQASVRPYRAIAPVVVLALSFAACSGENQAAAGAFARGYREVTQSYQERSSDIQERAQLVSGQGVDRILGVYEEILAATEAARDELAELEAPPEFQERFRDLVGVFDDQVEALSELVAAAEDRNISEVTSAAGRLTELRSNWESLQQEMEELFAACGEPCD